MNNELLDDVSIEELLQPFPLLRDFEQAADLSRQYNISLEDVLLIGLNASGMKLGNIQNDRGRFTITFPNGNRYFLALTITSRPLSSFSFVDGKIFLNDKEIAHAGLVEKDTCTDSYWRGAKKHLTLNSNSRSNCRGCTFCGTYSLEDDDKALTSEEALIGKVKSLCEDLDSDNLSQLESIGVVTGCFPGEKQLVEHLLMVRKVFRTFGFNGELRYIGSQLRSPEALQRMVDSGPFALYLTVEAFERRDQLMKKTKASLDLESGRKLLKLAKDMGAETSFLYIAGLDNLSTMEVEFFKYTDTLTRLPLIQTFQAYMPDQLMVRNPDAAKLEYFLKARTIVEQALPQFRPQAFSNYRGLWYSSFAEETLPNEII